MARSTRGVILLMVALLLTGMALPELVPSIDWHVMGSGGGQVTAGNRSLAGTLGQAVVGSATSGGTGLCAGFWCGVESAYEFYLPLILRRAHS